MLASHCALLKALPPVCMKYTAQGKSWMEITAKAKLSAIFAMRLSPRAVYILSYSPSGSALSVLLYFTL